MTAHGNHAENQKHHDGHPKHNEADHEGYHHKTNSGEHKEGDMPKRRSSELKDTRLGHKEGIMAKAKAKRRSIEPKATHPGHKEGNVAKPKRLGSELKDTHTGHNEGNFPKPKRLGSELKDTHLGHKEGIMAKPKRRSSEPKDTHPGHKKGNMARPKRRSSEPKDTQPGHAGAQVETHHHQHHDHQDHPGPQGETHHHQHHEHHEHHEHQKGNDLRLKDDATRTETQPKLSKSLFAPPGAGANMSDATRNESEATAYDGDDENVATIDRKTVTFDTLSYASSAMSGPPPFFTKSARVCFCRKVLLVLCMELLVCATFTTVTVFVKPLWKFFKSLEGYVVTLCCGATFEALSLAIGCFRLGCGKPSPLNISLLVILVILSSIFLAGTCAYVENFSVLFAISATILTFFILFLILFISKVNDPHYCLCLVGGLLAAGTFTGMCLGVYFYRKPVLYWLFYLSTVLSGLFAVFIVACTMFELVTIVKGRFFHYEDEWLYVAIALFGRI